LTSTLAFWTAHFCVHTCTKKQMKNYRQKNESRILPLALLNTWSIVKIILYDINFFQILIPKRRSLFILYIFILLIWQTCIDCIFFLSYTCTFEIVICSMREYTSSKAYLDIEQTFNYIHHILIQRTMKYTKTDDGWYTRYYGQRLRLVL
jgi:hypothetical protein